MKFNMSINENFAKFTDEENDVTVFIDSFDNENFDIRIGSLTDSVSVALITATSDEELNLKLMEVYKKYRGCK
ncbi:MAG: hypothetical protein ACTIM4_00710 [Marinomonas sp.]